jgi:hypothetical protein
MNERLSEFLMSLVQDPERLEAFNGDDDTARASIVEAADLSPSEKEALLSDDSAAILTLLQASEENGLTWVGIPRIKTGEDEPRIKFTLGFAVFAGGSGPIGATSRARSSQRGKKTSTAKGAAGRAVKRSSGSSAKASTSRTKSAGKAAKSRPKAKRSR